ncbi:hypothetical protein [Thalassomonas actiniarum]|uniref:Uncharacterized protein n=2 Tax=Thalassomonas TaxID=137583 RepID=A0AAF0C615_9GAMM|nr:hypothetical protein [Thalassomonas actiniarum]WDE02113.1 hypothetical protein SG35_030590 [Thalassomonas actiniarum]
MKLTLNKNKLKNLSKDYQALPAELTPNIGGGQPMMLAKDTGPSFCTQQQLAGHTGPTLCTAAKEA